MTSTVISQRPAFCTFHSSQVIASTYQLDSDSNSRAGSLHFLDPKDLSSLRVVPTPAGVFRFEIVGDTIVSALTDGSLHYISLTDFSTKTVKLAEDMLLNVSVSGETAAVTTNKGEVLVVDYPSGKVVSSWIGHKLPYTSEPCEVWSVALSVNQLCTGGEDSFLTFWDPRSGASTGCCKIFEAGVTYLRWRDDHTLLTGSYDQKIRLLDSRNLREAVTETAAPGGVWHIESLGDGPSERHLAACMYGGFVILDSDWNLVFQNEEAGKDLLYGVTFVDPSTVVYTTFNDYRVSVYSIS